MLLTTSWSVPTAVDDWRDLQDLVVSQGPLFVRHSDGPAHDAIGGSTDTESGLVLPGLSVNPLSPESWWTRSLGDWLARQLRQYAHLSEGSAHRFAWVLQGRVVGRGPDCEPLLDRVRPIAPLSSGLLVSAAERYARAFDAGRGPLDD